MFASFFGAGAAKLATHLGVPQEITQRMSEEFWDHFPEIKDWHRSLHKFYARNGYVTGLSGFRRRAPVKHTEIINTPIQSDEAIMVFDGMIRLSELREPQYYANMMIHDDLTFIWPKKKVDEYAETVVRTLLDCPFQWAHTVPIVVEMSVGPNWADMKEVAAYESDRWDGRIKQVANE